MYRRRHNGFSMIVEFQLLKYAWLHGHDVVSSLVYIPTMHGAISVTPTYFPSEVVTNQFPYKHR